MGAARIGQVGMQGIVILGRSFVLRSRSFAARLGPLLWLATFLLCDIDFVFLMSNPVHSQEPEPSGVMVLDNDPTPKSPNDSKPIEKEIASQADKKYKDDEQWKVKLGGHMQMDYVLWANAAPSIPDTYNYFN